MTSSLEAHLKVRSKAAQFSCQHPSWTGFYANGQLLVRKCKVCCYLVWEVPVDEKEEASR